MNIIEERLLYYYTTIFLQFTHKIMRKNINFYSRRMGRTLQYLALLFTSEKLVQCVYILDEELGNYSTIMSIYFYQ